MYTCTKFQASSKWVVGSDDGAGYLPVPGRPTTLAYGRAGGLLCLQQVRDSWAVFCFISSILSSFSTAGHTVIL